MKKGFTLVEILIALALMAIVMAGVYSIYSSSTKAFHVQSQILKVQDQLRFAIEHIKRDIRKAAFLGTPNSDVDNSACRVPFKLLGIAFEIPQSPAVVLPGVNVNVTPLNLILFGPYVTTKTFYTSQIQGQNVYLMQTDFGQTNSNFPKTQEEFDLIFKKGRILKLVNKDQFEMYYKIESADYSTGKIVVDAPIQRATADKPCGYYSFGERLEVNVLTFIRYKIDFDTRVDNPSVKTDLVKEELVYENGSFVPVQGSKLHIADYIVDMMFYDFIFDMGSPQNPSIVHYATYTESNLVTTSTDGKLNYGANAIPEKLRFLTIKLSARTPQEDPDLFFTQRKDQFSPLNAYDIDKNMKGACRVFTMASRVQLKTFMDKGL